MKNGNAGPGAPLGGGGTGPIGGDGGTGPIGGGAASRTILKEIAQTLKDLSKQFTDLSNAPMGGAAPAKKAPAKKK